MIRGKARSIVVPRGWSSDPCGETDDHVVACRADRRIRAGHLEIVHRCERIPQARRFRLAREVAEREQRVDVLLLERRAVCLDPSLSSGAGIGLLGRAPQIGSRDHGWSDGQLPGIRDRRSPRRRSAYLDLVVAGRLGLEVVGRPVGAVGGLAVDLPEEREFLALRQIDRRSKADRDAGWALDPPVRRLERGEAERRGFDFDVQLRSGSVVLRASRRRRGACARASR